ncbi:GspE/PulE family protein [Rhodocaloribacter litoris]|uniref:GspE/PulE family protein n=1 Tax=Rhodocaloribacter litoris TaxID=2558931 RepID=UPI001E309A70|nr:GspE/PulE family protein [Rhodocaloribacter litoris]
MREKTESFSFRQQFRRIQRLLDNATVSAPEAPESYELADEAPARHDDLFADTEAVYLEPPPSFEREPGPSPDADLEAGGDGYPVDVEPEAPGAAPAAVAPPRPPYPRHPAPADPGDEFAMLVRRDRVVTQLMAQGIVPEKKVRLALEQWKRMRREGVKTPLWRVLTRDKELDRERLYAVAARVYAFEEIQLREDETLQFLRGINEVFTEEQWDQMIDLFVLPVAQEKEPYRGELRWIFATNDPARPEVNHLLQQLAVRRFELRYAPESVITSLITQAFLGKNEFLERLNEDPMAFDLGMSYEDRQNELIDEEALEAEISRSSLINLFEAALVDAVHQGASDIHIYPNPDRQIEIHFRIDGELKRWHTEERIHPEAFLAVAKDNAAGVDRFDRDIAQDGFIQRWIDGALIRFRVSVLPIASAAQEIRAESIVIRVLDDRKVLTDLRELGMLEVALKRFNAAIREPHGMVILTGPTGSGKSTTLVAALHQVISPKVNVLTVEDPVEYIIKGVRQIKLSHRLDLEGALRAILRHDPDIVMVGEMRDRATAELAIKLANTGHLTFSTLHTNDAPSAVSRLYKMGVEPFLIAYAINLVVAQRLIRKLCPTCKTVDTDLDHDLLGHLGFKPEEIAATTFYRPGNDPHCKTCRGAGYKGRRAVAEAMLFSRTIRSMIMEAEDMIDEEALRDQAVKEGMLTLQDSAREVVKMGDTSIEELLRVTGGSL